MALALAQCFCIRISSVFRPRRIKNEQIAGHVLQAEHPHLAAEFGGAYHEACDHVPVAVEVFRGGMHHHVGAQPQRILQSGRGEGVVADHLDVLVISVRHLGHGGNVRDL